MTDHLDENQLQQLREQLQQRYATLKDEVRQEIAASGHDHRAYLDEGAHDAGDASVADQLAELNLSLLDQHIQALRDIETALARIENGTYGVCIDSGEPIPFARLAANPTALRSIECQERYERTHAQPGHASL